MANEGYVEWLNEMKLMFLRSTSALTEEDSEFAPLDGMYTVAQHFAQVALTVEWFVDGGLRGEPFDLDFEKGERKVRQVRSLSEGRDLVQAAFQRAMDTTAELSEADLNLPLPEGPIMGGQPRYTVYGAICDHTAHHRGALTVYTRLLGKKPPMPYSD